MNKTVLCQNDPRGPGGCDGCENGQMVPLAIFCGKTAPNTIEETFGESPKRTTHLCDEHFSGAWGAWQRHVSYLSMPGESDETLLILNGTPYKRGDQFRPLSA
jgi:hypothetical protein